MEYLPAKRLSDRGANFLSDLLHKVYVLLGIRKSVLQRTTPKLIWLGCEIIVVETGINESLVLYAYQTCVQESTQESPFYLLYGRDARLPEAALAKPCTCYQMDIDDFKTILSVISQMPGAWLTKISTKPKRSKNNNMIRKLR